MTQMNDAIIELIKKHTQISEKEDDILREIAEIASYQAKTNGYFNRKINESEIIHMICMVLSKYRVKPEVIKEVSEDIMQIIQS